MSEQCSDCLFSGPSYPDSISGFETWCRNRPVIVWISDYSRWSTSTRTACNLPSTRKHERGKGFCNCSTLTWVSTLPVSCLKSDVFTVQVKGSSVRRVCWTVGSRWLIFLSVVLLDRFCVLIKTNGNVWHRIFFPPRATMAPMGIRLSPLGVLVFCLLGVGVIYHLYAGVISSRWAAFRWEAPSSGGCTLLYKGWAKLDQGVQTLLKELIKHHIISFVSCQNSCCKDYRLPHHTDSPAWFLSEPDVCLLTRVRYLLFSSLYNIKPPRLSPFSHCSLLKNNRLDAKLNWFVWANQH